jgi:hypothetical protein
MNEIVNELERLAAEMCSMRFSAPQYGTIEEIKMWTEGCEECQAALLRLISSRVDELKRVKLKDGDVE